MPLTQIRKVVRGRKNSYRSTDIQSLYSEVGCESLFEKKTKKITNVLYIAINMNQKHAPEYNQIFIAKWSLVILLFQFVLNRVFPLNT